MPLMFLIDMQLFHLSLTQDLNMSLNHTDSAEIFVQYLLRTNYEFQALKCQLPQVFSLKCDQKKSCFHRIFSVFVTF